MRVEQRRLNIEERLRLLIDAPGAIYPERQIGKEFGEWAWRLRSWGALSATEPLRHLWCVECGDDHPVDLEFNQAVGVYQYFCPSAGLVVAQENDLRTFTVREAWLFELIERDLAVRRPHRRELVDGVLWDLGEAETGQRPFTVLFGRSVSRWLDEIVGALADRAGKLAGVVITSSVDWPRRISMPHGHRFVPLSDCLLVEETGAGICRASVLSALRRPPRAADKAPRPGRPGVRDIVLAEFRRRAASGEVRPTLSREAAAVAEWLQQEQADLTPRSPKTIANIIRAAHRDLRAEAPRPTK